MKIKKSKYGLVDYSINAVPKKYICTKCKAHGCKLWRQYSTFANHIKLMCGTCSLKGQEKQGPIDQFGKRPDDYGGSTDQIGWMVPAIPTEEGDTFWGYSSVPEAGIRWWVTLPTTVES